MQVTVYSVAIELHGKLTMSYFVSEGLGPVMEFGSSSVAGAVARGLSEKNGIDIDVHVAEMWLRHGATDRRFASVGAPEFVDDGSRLETLMENGPDGEPYGDALYVAFDGKGKLIGDATVHRIEAIRALGGDYARGNTR